jgi:squalene-hopene/tetraprenyl-beta-curcumene cyclase
LPPLPNLRAEIVAFRRWLWDDALRDQFASSLGAVPRMSSAHMPGQQVKRSTAIATFVALLGLAWACPAVAVEMPAPTELQIRATIERSLPYLEQAGVQWIENKKCVSCHRVSFLTWSLSEASRKGFEVDRAKLQGWVDWSIEKSLESKGEGKPVDGALNLEGVAQLVLALPVDSVTPLPQDERVTFLQLIVKGQQADGSWKAGGQLPSQKRPLAETMQVGSLWNVLALGSSADAEATAARERALAWLAAASSGKSTEWYAVRLLVSRQQSDEELAKSLQEKLRSQQNADGGWGWLVGDPSDALGTGLAIYALSRTGVPSDDSAITRARQFLVSTQRPNGSWEVRGTKEAKKGRGEETASYWGTAWAAIGLLQTLP